MRVVARRPKAIRDIEDQWFYLLEHGGVGVADRFLNAIEQTGALLLSSPEIGMPCHFERLQAAEVRRFPITLPFGRWILYYRPTERGISMLRLVHGNRDRRGFVP
ncbi:type II toxin-antitoxin system RelE/ParE family toxin [Granulicella sibirica]|uniref:type II toxin-antitoxin system RelE/ParE family toxin n=1 Tax=Granulicella sibirica TaxID=2479048 RepID=UPI001009067E